MTIQKDQHGARSAERGIRKVVIRIKKSFFRTPSSAFRADLYSIRGQAMTEMVFILPLLVMLAAGAIATGYMCYQGVKVQQAANFAARVQGQQHVGGGPSIDDINRVNGLGDGAGDQDISTLQGLIPARGPGAGRGTANWNRPWRQTVHPVQHPPSDPRSVFGNYYTAVRKMFGPGEQANLSIPAPTPRGDSDEVRVQRLLQPPPVITLQIPKIFLEGKAYGGEDPRFYALPNWGPVQPGGTDLFYQHQIRNPSND